MINQSLTKPKLGAEAEADSRTDVPHSKCFSGPAPGQTITFPSAQVLQRMTALNWPRTGLKTRATRGP